MESSENRVLVTGATGLVGRRLLPELAKRFSAIRTLSRSAPKDPGATTAAFNSSSPSEIMAMEGIQWDGVDPGPSALGGVDTVIHLAGEPIFGGLPTSQRLARVRASRIDSTRCLVDRILERPVEDRPTTLVCASAVGIYGEGGEERLDEATPAGRGFLAEVCRDWEAEAERAKASGVRVVALRIGVVLAREGGALGLMKIPFGLGVGGRLGSGQQFFPWIHAEDLVGAILWCVESNVEGPVNAVAPEEVRNVDLTRALGRVLGRPTILPVPAFALRLALGEFSGELLGSRRVVSRRLEEGGYVFKHPTLRSALEAELG